MWVGGAKPWRKAWGAMEVFVAENMQMVLDCFKLTSIPETRYTEEAAAVEPVLTTDRARNEVTGDPSDASAIGLPFS